MNTWSQVLARIEQVVDRSDYDNWLARTKLISQKGDTLDIAVPSQRYVDEIRERFGAQIRGLLNEISAERLQVHFVVDDLGHDDLPIALAPPKDELASATFNPRYRFDTFVV